MWVIAIYDMSIYAIITGALTIQAMTIYRCSTPYIGKHSDGTSTLVPRAVFASVMAV